tara:strand:- start:196 stop:429 length:234 start_codon:yes stop_codon:yes gene_type:complete
MIIPVKCFTCGNVLADKYRWYAEQVREQKIKEKVNINEVVYLTKDNVKKTAEGRVLDTLKLNKMCCRRHMLTHIDIE